MKSKKLALANGIVGLAGGIFMLFGSFIPIMMGAAAVTASESDYASMGAFTVFSVAVLYIVKIAVLVLGIYGLVYYKNDSRIQNSPNILLIVGGAISLIPMLGWIGGILSIIGGSMCLSSLKKFNTDIK
ncbi:hypothetical protein [Companilactobacillus insicii]|uniref:hypothetical protein n=1 Tax=Companilactobacillus insicii TaxID=1732567 RepID=UPI000F7ABE76|nr:hypothetical protein [Companilactobacillus insicii]